MNIASIVIPKSTNELTDSIPATHGPALIQEPYVTVGSQYLWIGEHSNILINSAATASAA